MKSLTPFLFSVAMCTYALNVTVAMTEKPNITVIYADDIGCGDVSHCGATGRALQRLSDWPSLVSFKHEDWYCYNELAVHCPEVLT